MPLEVRRCKNCQSPLSADAKFCAKCGAEQVEHNACAYCQAPLENGSKFCSACGAPTEAPKDPMEEKLAVKTLVFGILGAAFSLSFWFSFMGIIFSAVARGKLNQYLAYTGGSIKDPRAGVGKGLSIGGLIAGIVFTVLLVIVIICAISGVFDHIFEYYADLFESAIEGGFEGEYYY
jgi:RNA polymerase subunit RPABC4/transcription elongation factor Spt4